MKCPVPGCALKLPHVPYVTDFCHHCGSNNFLRKMFGLLCEDCGVFVDNIYVEQKELPKDEVV